MTPTTPPPPPRTVWTKLWTAWLLAFLLIEIPAAIFTQGAAGTLSVTIWSRWFTGFTIFFVAAFLVILILHFKTRGRHWWSGGLAVIVGGIPVALTIVWRERDMFGKIVGKVVGGVKSAWKFTLRRGPVISSLLTGIALVVPQAAPILRIIAGLVAGGTGADQQTVEGTAELVNGALLAIGAIRKFWSLAKPVWKKLQAGGVDPTAGTGAGPV